MQRGEVWWAEFPAPVGRRPIVILSRDRAIQVRSHVTVAQLTRTIRDIPVEVPLGSSDGLPKKCVANLDVVNTIPKSLLKERICLLSLAKIKEIEVALRFALGME